MESSSEKPAEEQKDANALEIPEGSADSLESATGDENKEQKTDAEIPLPKKPGGFKAFLRRFNIYLLLFVFVLVLAGIVVVIAYFQGKQDTNTTLKGQDLTTSVLSQLASSDATVGEAKQVLNVQSNAVFSGKVLARNALEVAGTLQVSGNAAVNALTVSDTSSLGQVQISKNLAVAGDAGIQGQLTVAKGLQVNGGGTFSGSLTAPQITTSNFQLNGDLILTHHIVAGGSQPGRTTGPAVGNGGTATVSGSDTSGSVGINTGSNPPAGCFITINFAQKYTSAPRVVVTPVGSDAGIIDYYVTRNSSSFSICDSTPPPTGVSFSFDYFIVN